MEELIAAGITTLDIVVVYVFLQVGRRKFALILWTTFFNIALPFFGFVTGEFSSIIFSGWSTLLSSVLLGLVGLHMLLYDGDEQSPSGQLHPAIIALAVSIDSFSVSVSFGMLQMSKILYISASGFFSFIFAYLSLNKKEFLGVKTGKLLRRLAGLTLIIIGVWSWIY